MSVKDKRSIRPVQSSEEIVASLEEIFERKIDVDCAADMLSHATPKKQNLSVAVAGGGGGGGNGTKKKAKRNHVPKSGDPPVDITPPSEVVLPPADIDEQSVKEDPLPDAADLVWCLAASLLQSDGWSYREIEKFLKGILSAVLSTER